MPNLHGEVSRTLGFLPSFSGELQSFLVVFQMEVMASRHKDDNSIACIVDKCYVLSYPDYCR